MSSGESSANPRANLLKIVGIGAGAWGSVFAALLQDAYGQFCDKIQIRIWRRPGRSVDRSTAEHLFEVINSREDVLRRLIGRCAYLKYVEGRLGDRVLYADEILRDGFCLNMIETPLCPMKVVTNLQEAVWDADIVVNGLPSTETREVFEEISRYWKERLSVPIIISLAKGIEAALDPLPRIVTPTQMIQCAISQMKILMNTSNAFFFNKLVSCTDEYYRWMAFIVVIMFAASLRTYILAFGDTSIPVYFVHSQPLKFYPPMKMENFRFNWGGYLYNRFLKDKMSS